MNLLASLLMFLGGLILFSVLTALARLLSRGRGGIGCGLIAPIAALVLIIAGGSFYLDNNGDVVPGTLVAKNEDIITYDTGTYTRFLDVDVSFKPSGAELPTTVRLPIDGPLFDRLHNGETVDVRYLNPLGLFLFSRLKQQTTLSLISVVIPWETVWPLFLFFSLVALMYFWARKPRRNTQDIVEPGSEAMPPPSFRRPVAFVLFLAWLGVAIFTLFQPALLPVSTAGWQTATAQVKDSRRYTQVAESRRTSRNVPLIQNFDMIQFTFTPQGVSDPVIGVDVIDSAASGLPDQGSALTIKYPANNPRVAQIPGATYTHFWKNPLGALGLFLASSFALAMLWFLPRLIWRIFTQGLVAAIARRQS